jgi:hypothetical protein
MDKTVVIRGLIRILTKADNHDNGVTYEVSLYQAEYDAIEEAIRLLEADQTVPVEWIPCSERLPEDDRTKVVTLANGNAEAGYYSNGDWWCVGDSINLENPKVIAWMPLPKPYEEKQ